MKPEFINLPRIPDEPGTIITFLDISPLRLSREYYIRTKVGEVKSMTRISDRFLMGEIDRLNRELGSLFYVTVRYIDKSTKLELINNPNPKLL